MIIEPVKLHGKERQTGDITHPELNKNGRHCIPENSGESGASSQQFDNCEKPYVGMEFESEEAARSFYDAYANRSGFCTQVCQYHRSKPNGPVTAMDFVCSSEASRRKNVESCSAILRLVRKNSEHFVVTKFVDNHSHPSESPKKVHCVRPQRHISGAAENVYEPLGYQNKAVVFPDRKDVLSDASLGIKNTCPVDMHHISGHTFLVPPVHFIQPFSRKRSLGNDAQNLLDYFQKMQVESPGFYYAIQLDAENRMTNVFWADARSRAAYSYFGDAVIFDTMYRPNQFQVPCAPFTGVNHHGQIVLFGCALILDESESSFTWLFRTWLSAMNNPPPVSITTDQDRVIKAAVNQVLPET
ncbi:hypothetical protein LIER_32951 [Lithospermum erythrorhizon]|uniref:Protein FAR1-RELATED SEQUENCE n=1 Tax=Lithospermum erythrorhizon TaxID=34254 RepID=A0AAV3RX15_LITER